MVADQNRLHRRPRFREVCFACRPVYRLMSCTDAGQTDRTKKRPQGDLTPVSFHDPAALFTLASGLNDLLGPFPHPERPNAQGTRRGAQYVSSSCQVVPERENGWIDVLNHVFW